MKILLIGNGGRENALAWKIFNSVSFQETKSRLYNTIGSPGINEFAGPVDINPSDTEKLISFVKKEGIDFTVVGPELPLSAGIVNEFGKNGLKIFGPSKEAAEIESSKIFSKKLMSDNNVPTARYKDFSGKNINEAKEFLRSCKYPVVIKADGLAAGKGVIIADNIEEAIETIELVSLKNIFGEAGNSFIIEEFLEGEEVSVFVITDGRDYRILPFSQDHKKIYDGDKGKNTGGMGAVAPLKKFMKEETTAKIKTRIIEPVLKALTDSGREFKGCLYCGLMMVKDEPLVIEFNCRFGDPETQAVLPLIKSDFLQLLLASAGNGMGNYKLEINDSFACCVVMASEGYPDDYKKEKEITGFENDNKNENSIVFHSGTKFTGDGKVVSSGGRVLSVVGISDVSMEEALKNCYERISGIEFVNKYFRRDIGGKQI